MAAVNTTERLAKLRSFMKERGVDVYVVPSEDSHSSEYIAACDARREWISGFTGSAGTAVVSLDKAALATDGRYFNQAARQLDQNWTLLKQGLQDVPTWQEWSADEAAAGKTVGVDPTLITSSEADKLRERIKKVGGADLVAVPDNLVDAAWAAGKPARPNQPVTLQPLARAGKSPQDKLTELRKDLDKKKLSGFVVSMLDEVAWLFNLRGSDIPFNPVFFAYAIVTPNSAALYIDAAKLGPDGHASLAENGVEIKPYHSIFDDTKALGASVAASAGSGAPAKKFGISTRTSWALQLALGGKDIVDEVRSPVGDAKAIKNDVELEGMRQAHIRDGAALIEYFAWLEDQLIAKKATIDEVTAADKLEELRAKQKHYVGLSFPTISSTGANAAVIHYKPERGSCAVIDPKAIYLCDSGAQFNDGTTDVTRTMHFGTPSEKERYAYSLVLKGNIALDQAVFPKGTTGYAIDCFARQHLWREGLDYRHGTGHGVGSFLNVHEGPIGIGTRKNYVEVPLASGNVVSNEPGFYEDGAYGIRIENIVLVREVQTRHQFGDKPYLGFEHVTMVPYARNLIDTAMLTEGEKAWVNEYHRDIWEKTQGFFEDGSLAKKWLERETGPL